MNKNEKCAECKHFEEKSEKDSNGNVVYKYSCEKKLNPYDISKCPEFTQKLSNHQIKW